MHPGSFSVKMEIVKNFIERLRRFSPLRGFQDERRRLEQRAEAAESRAAEADKRLAAFFKFTHSFLEANDEREVVELVLRLSVDSVGAQGASLVPVDERGQPMTAVNYGDLPTPVFSAWVEYLASPAIRQRCSTCQNHGAITKTCPLLNGPFSETVALYCLPLRRGDRQLGVLNLYLPDGHRLTPENQAFLKTMVDETALVLEIMRLQKREMAALSELQAVRRRTDLKSVLDGFLENVRDTFKSDLALLRVEAHNLQQGPMMLTLGEIPVQGRAFIDSILQGVLASMEPVLLGDGHRSGLAGDPDTPQGFTSLLAVPLLPQEGAVLGAVLVGNRRPKYFTRRHLRLLRTLAGQLALIIQNENLMAELEYKAMMQERTRLAREIHDGLAQTLGFLKLQTAQMKNSLAQGDIARLQQSLDLSYQTLTEAYKDARQAIDSLRIHPAEEGMVAWLERTVVEFQENHDFVVELSVEDCGADLPPEVQAQLMRIVQEALNNVRKHARASRACVRCYINGRDLFLEVRDDGRGFAPDDVPSTSRYGLQGMRERAELIGGEFQVISCPQEGTTVRVRLPMVVGEKIA